MEKSDRDFIENVLGFEVPSDEVIEASVAALQEEVIVADKVEEKDTVEVDDNFMRKLAVGLKKIMGLGEEDSADVELADINALKVGDKVSWTAEGKSYKGTVLSINRNENTVKVKDDASDFSPTVPVGSLTVVAKSKPVEGKTPPKGAAPSKNPFAKVTASEESSAGESSAGESSAEEHYAIQTPISLAGAEKVGARRFKKALLPVDRTINYERNGVKKVLTFSRDMLERFVSNLKAKAFDQVPLLALHPKDPTVNPDHYHGELVDAEMDGEWLYGIFETTERGAKAIEDNPNLPTSVGYLDDYTRKADGKHFGPSLQHVAFTYTPAVPGVKGWDAVVQMSEVDAEGDVVVVNLTGEDSFAGPGKREETVVTETKTDTTKEVSEEVNMVSLDEFNALKAEHEESSRILRRQGIRKMLSDEYGRAGVPEAKITAAYTLLDAAQGGNEMITLSAMGDASFSDNSKATAIKELLEGYKGTIEFGEFGSTEEPEALTAEEKIDKRARELSMEKGVDYGTAFDIALSEFEGVK